MEAIDIQRHTCDPEERLTPWVHAIARYKLIDLWGRRAGSLPSFERYSEALRSSGIVWDERSLDG